MFFEGLRFPTFFISGRKWFNLRFFSLSFSLFYLYSTLRLWQQLLKMAKTEKQNKEITTAVLPAVAVNDRQLLLLLLAHIWSASAYTHTSWRKKTDHNMPQKPTSSFPLSGKVFFLGWEEKMWMKKKLLSLMPISSLAIVSHWTFL